VLGLLVVVWLNLTLQGCAIASPDTPLVDRPVASSELDSSRTHSSHAQPEQCPFCEHERCTEGTPCDGPVTAGTKAETRLSETHELESTAAVAVDDVDHAVNTPDTSPVRPTYRAVTAAVPLNIQYCVYLI
jgi:hypothetical protein